MSIKTFRHKGLRRLYHDDDASGVQPEWADNLRHMLHVIDTASSVRDIGQFPGWKLHPLKGDRKGSWGLTITGNWRLTFRFEKGDAFDLNIEDYH